MVKFFQNYAYYFLRKYKKIDVKMRRNPYYEYFSFTLFNIIRKIVGLKKLDHRRLVEHHYHKNFDTIEVDKRTVLFDCFWGRKIGGDPYAIYRKMKERQPDFCFIWVKEKGVVPPCDVKEDSRVRFVQHGSKKYAEALLKAKYLVCNSNFLPFFIKKDAQVFVNTWHGVPLKKLGLDIDQPIRYSANTQRNFNLSDIIPVSGTYEIEKTLQSYGCVFAHENAEVIGSPRIDLTLDANYDDVKKRLGVDKRKKTILYAPTWRGSIVSVSSQISDQVAAIEEIERKLGDDFFLLVSLHHLTMRHLKRLNKKINIVPESIDINEVLQGVDVLVTDYSSIMVDFLVLDRPIILHVPDYEEYNSSRGLNVDIFDLPCRLTSTAKDLIDAIREETKPSSFPVFEKCLGVFFQCELGNSTDRLLDIIFCSKGGLLGKEKLNNNHNNKNILIYPGALKDSGITSSLKNLVTSLEDENVTVYLLIDARFEKRVPEFLKNFNFLKKACRVIIIDRLTMFFDEDVIARKKYLFDLPSTTPQEVEGLRKAMKNEALRIFGNKQFDVAIDFSGYSYYWSLFMSTVNADKKIIYQHSDMKAEADNPKRNHKFIRNVFFNYKYFDKVASVSDSIKDVNIKNIGNTYGPAQPIAIPNVVNFDRVLHQSNAPVSIVSPEFHGVPEGVVKYLSVSRLSPEKNINALIEAFSEVVKSGKECVLFIVGKGPQEKSLKNLAAMLGVDDRVVFTGHLNNPYPLIRNADCLILPSLYEGQGLVLLEAMSLSTFCIGNDIPAIREVLQDKGCYISKANLYDLSLAMIEVDSGFSKRVNFDYRAYFQTSVSRFISSIS